MILALELCLPKATRGRIFTRTRNSQKNNTFFGIKSIKSITFKKLIP